MGYSTGKELHVNMPLTNIAMAYQPKNNFGELIAPIVTVQKQSDSYYIFSIAEAYAIEDDKRAPGTEANRITRSVSSGTYFCKNYALKDNIPYEDIKNADVGILLMERAARAQYIKDKLYLNWNYRVGLQCSSGSNVGSYSGVASNWSDGATGKSDPYTDIETAIENVVGVVGSDYRPNRIIFGATAWKLYRHHADIRTLIYGDGAGANGRIVTKEQVAALHEVDQIIVANPMYNSAQEGQTASLSYVWNTSVLVYYAPMQASKEKPSFMYSFRWQVVADMQAEVHQLPLSKAEQVELGYYQDEKITASTLGFLITDVRSSV